MIIDKVRGKKICIWKLGYEDTVGDRTI